jgi:hypothetical protein
MVREGAPIILRFFAALKIQSLAELRAEGAKSLTTKDTGAHGENPPRQSENSVDLLCETQ